MEYQISENLRGKFALKKTLKMGIILIAISVILLVILSNALNEGHSIFNTSIPSMIGFLTIVALIVWYFSNTNIASSYLFVIDDKEKALIKTLKTENLSLTNQLGAKRAARKYGTKHHQIIYFSEVSSTVERKRKNINTRRIRKLSRSFKENGKFKRRINEKIKPKKLAVNNGKFSYFNQ